MRRYKELLQLYQHPFNLVRLGRKGDGGYIVPKELINDNLLSCGICNDISFEEDYIKHISNPNVHCFDGTISVFPSESNTYNWHKLNIGSSDNEKEISLNSIFEKYYSDKEDVFVKMDIEEGEYPSFSTISDENLKKISCLVLEVHWIDRKYKEFETLMSGSCIKCNSNKGSKK